MGRRKRIGAHALTIAPAVRHMLFPVRAPDATWWEFHKTDPLAGDLRIRGLLRHEPGAETLVIGYHGLGGDPEAAYLANLARAASARGWSCLRLAMRGAGGIGRDFYHAGLTEDLHDAVAQPELAHYRRIVLVGYSLGGHIMMRAATEPRLDGRVSRIVAVCPPIDLAEGSRELDRPARTVYRRYILLELLRMYRALAEIADVPTPVARMELVRSLREWDSLAVVPRFGFRDVEHYYTSQGIAGRIEHVARPTLMIHSPHDPLIPVRVIEPALQRAPDHFDVEWVEGAGHVFFPKNLHLGFGDETGLANQALAWAGGDGAAM